MGSVRTPRDIRFARAALAAVVAVALSAAGAGSASALTLVPPKGTTYFGISDRGTVAEFDEFAGLVNHHPALLQTFHPYGNSLNEARERWAATKTRPMLAISTIDDQTLTELITPRQIAVGEGDNYLLQLNSFFAKNDIRAYVRPLGEPNRCRNAWTAIDCDGNPRGGDYTQSWYKRAFRRIAVVVRGGGTLEEINARLAEAGVPGLNRQGKPNPGKLAAAPVAMVWSPLPGGSPVAPGNYPGNYWPGGAYVDWVGTDFYAQYPVWKRLNHFFSQKTYANKPFSLTEWSVAGADDARFIRDVIGWARKRPRVRSLIYYRGFGEAGNQYRLGLYPKTTAALKRRLRQKRFLEYVPNPPTPAPIPTPAPPPTPTQPQAEQSRQGPQG